MKHVRSIALCFASACANPTDNAAPTVEPVSAQAEALTGTATYDTVLKAPKCATVQSGCDSATLVNGRSFLGPESNYPNTINNSCADGTGGTYHSTTGESLDALKVTTVDGSNFSPGKSVKIEANVWSSGVNNDTLDLYYAADATAPSWVFIGSISAPVYGAQTLTTNYTLPSGSLQAIRGAFRYFGSASTCPTNNTHGEADDLIFAVGTADTTPPVAAITTPVTGATVSGTVFLGTTATDNVAIAQVDVYIDNAYAGTSYASPYNFNWNTVGTANGSHTLQTVAWDTSNNHALSNLVTVTVTNSCTNSSFLVANSGFESGHTSWAETPYGILNNVGPYAAHNGTWKAQLRGKGFAGQDTLSQSATFTIPAGACSANFTFWAYILTAETQINAVDTLTVEILNSSGSVLTTTQNLSNANHNSGYQQFSASLMAYRGSQVSIRFRGNENASLQTTFLIDDVSVLAVF